MPPVTPISRDLKVEYGGYSAHPDGKIRIEKAYDRAAIEFDFLVTGNSYSAFAANCQDAEAAFRKVRQNCKVTLGSSTLFEGSHALYTAFDSYPLILKREDVGDTGRSRRYTVRIEFGMPADDPAVSGRRSSTVTVSYSPARRRTVTISGVYTGVYGVAARAKYEANIEAYAASVLSALGGTYELIEEPVAETNIGESLCTFTRVYQELIYEQVTALDDAEIVRQMFSFSRNFPAPGDTVPKTGGVQRLMTGTANYDCYLDATKTKDLVGKYNNVIRPWIIQKVKSILLSKFAAITDDVPVFDPVENRITARLEIVAAGIATLLENRVTTEDIATKGIVLLPVWLDNKNALAKYSFQGPAQLQRRIIETRRFVGSPHAPFSDPIDEYVSRPSGIDSSNAPHVAVLSCRESQTPLRVGFPPDTMDVVDYTSEILLEFYADYKPGTTAAAGGGRGLRRA